MAQWMSSLEQQFHKLDAIIFCVKNLDALFLVLVGLMAGQ